MHSDYFSPLLQQFGDSQFVPFTKACEVIGWATQTGRNRLSLGTFPIATVKRGARRYVFVAHLLAYLESEIKDAKVGRRKRKIPLPEQVITGYDSASTRG